MKTEQQSESTFSRTQRTFLHIEMSDPCQASFKNISLDSRKEIFNMVRRCSILSE